MSPRGRYLIVGLGNPGPKYAGNRHNVGKLCVGALARAHQVLLDKRRSKVVFGLGEINGNDVAIAQPQTFMNDSGRAVAPLVRFYKVPLQQLLVVFDDLDLPLGSIRMRPQGGSGGHNGMKSIIQHLGEQTGFPRLRIGIGRPPGRMDPAAYVLRDFSRDELEVVEQVVQQAVVAIDLWLRFGIEAAMNEVN